MPSPFPGMDPYLEDAARWPVFQHQFVACLYHIVLPSLVDRYRARVIKRQYQTEMVLFTSIVREDHAESYLEIRLRANDRLVTLIDVVSPANKQTPIGRDRYLAVRSDARDRGANLIEIDLVREGTPMLDYSRENLPPNDYTVSVTRSAQPDRYEIYTAQLQKRLPRFRLPLATDDRDGVLDLQAVFARCYDQAGFAKIIDYVSEPTVPLTDDQRQWVNQLLHSAGVRR